MQSVNICAFLALLCCASFITQSRAVPVAVIELPVVAAVEDMPTTLLDIETADQSGVDVGGEAPRAARGLGLLGGKFGGLGGLGGFGGLGGLKGFGGLGGGFGGLGHGLGLGGFGFKPFFGKF